MVIRGTRRGRGSLGGSGTHVPPRRWLSAMAIHASVMWWVTSTLPREGLPDS